MKDDRIGAFARAGIAGASKKYNSSYVEMLINNCRPEDEEFLLNELNKIEIDQDDKCGWHGIVMNIVHVRDEDIPNSILYWVYENSLCSCCREHITESMLRKGLLTPELRQECLHDANLEIRDMVEE